MHLLRIDHATGDWIGDIRSPIVNLAFLLAIEEYKWQMTGAVVVAECKGEHTVGVINQQLVMSVDLHQVMLDKNLALHPEFN